MMPDEKALCDRSSRGTDEEKLEETKRAEEDDPPNHPPSEVKSLMRGVHGAIVLDNADDDADVKDDAIKDDVEAQTGEADDENVPDGASAMADHNARLQTSATTGGADASTKKTPQLKKIPEEPDEEEPVGDIRNRNQQAARDPRSIFMRAMAALHVVRELVGDIGNRNPREPDEGEPAGDIGNRDQQAPRDLRTILMRAMAALRAEQQPVRDVGNRDQQAPNEPGDGEPVGDVGNRDQPPHDLRTTLLRAMVALHVLPIVIFGISVAGAFTATGWPGRLAIWLEIVGWIAMFCFSWCSWSETDAEQQLGCVLSLSIGGIVASFLTQTFFALGTMADCVRIPWMWCFYFLVGGFQGFVCFYFWFKLSPFVEPFVVGGSLVLKWCLIPTWTRKLAAAVYVALVVIGIIILARLFGELRVDDTLFPDPETSLHRKPYPDDYVSFTVGTKGSVFFNEEFIYYFWLLCGAPIVASRGGTVTLVRQNNEDTYWKRNHNSALLNNKIAIDHGDGTATTYSCIQKGSAVVKEGDVVEQGAIIALAGMGGSFCSVPGVLMITHDKATWDSIPVPFQDIGILGPLQFN